jgi:hypothetical protein
MRLKRNHQLASFALATLLAVMLAGCGGGQPEPTATPAAAPAAQTEAATEAATAAATATTAPAEAAAALESPLAQPDSPLTPDSPLPVPTLGALPPAIGADGRPLSDIEAIRQISAANVPQAPDAGKASLSALLFSNSLGTVIPGTLAYLAPTIEENGQVYPPSGFAGPDEAEGDVRFYTDDYGRINATDVTPGSYVLAVWTVYDYIVVEDPNTPGYPVIFDIKPGDQLNLGLLQLPWP